MRPANPGFVFSFGSVIVEIKNVTSNKEVYKNAVEMWKEIRVMKEYSCKEGNNIRPPFNPRLMFEKEIVVK